MQEQAVAEGETGGGDAISMETPGVKELIDQAVSAAVNPLKANRDEILNEKKSVAQKLADMEKTWGGMDPTQVKSLMEKIANDDETRLIAEGKIDEVLQKRTGALKQDYETRLTGSEQALKEREERIAGLTGKISHLTLSGSIRDAASQLGLQPTAVADAIVRAQHVFKLDDNFNPQARDEHGTLMLGKDGKNGLSVAEWLEGMRKDAPHWFAGSTGAGSTGGAGPGQGGQYTLTREQARDPATYRAAKAAADKAGKTLAIVEG